MNTFRQTKWDLEQECPSSSWNTMLVPVDFSSQSVRAARLAVKAAQQNGGRVVLLHVIAPPAGREDADFCFLDEEERAAKTKLSKWSETHLGSSARMAEICVRVSASPESTIRQLARRLGAHVIVLSASNKHSTNHDYEYDNESNHIHHRG